MSESIHELKAITEIKSNICRY